MNPVSENKTRHTTVARSAYDFQAGDTLVTNNGGGNLTKAIVKSVDLAGGSITVMDPTTGAEQTISLDPNNVQKGSDGEFKYWIDESRSQKPMKPNLRECDDDYDSDIGLGDEPLDDMGSDIGLGDEPLDDMGSDVDLGSDGDFDDMDGDMGDDGEIVSDDDLGFDDDDDDDAPYVESSGGKNFSEDLRSFLGEDGDTDQIPDETVGGSVDDTEHADNDGEGTEPTPAPHDTTGMEDAGDVNTLAGDRSSNTGGSAPEDEVETNGDAGGPDVPTGPVLPDNGEHEPGDPDKHESIREDVSTALSLVHRSNNPKAVAEMIAARLLNGA